MTFSPVFHIARQELTVNVRNKWTLIFAVIFGILVTGIAYFGMIAEGFSGMQNFARSSASVLNLVLYIIPLVSLAMGTLSFTGDKGSAELLFSQPVLSSEVIMGKALGLFASIALSMASGFMVAGIMIISKSGPQGLTSYLAFTVLSLGLAFVFLSLSILVATLARRKSKAFGFALFLWFFFVLFYDILAIGITLLLSGSTMNLFLFLSLFGNPVDVVRVASLIIFDTATIFGPAGAALLRFLGGSAMSVTLLVCALLLWAILPMALAVKIMRRQDF
ncbi:MAG: ABC transporter permease subunit [Ignavibacteriales bacterium]|nr:ABC transporter permease subunit [Ignavibacteriales bacterium]